MVSFQPTFKLMLVSLNVVLLLGLQSTPALANGLQAGHDNNAHADTLIRRHAARAGRLSKRFPPHHDSHINSLSMQKRQRQHRKHGIYGLTPEEIDQLLEDEEVEDSNIYIPPSNTTNTTSTHTHSHSRTRSASDSDGPTGTSTHRFALPTANSSSAFASASDSTSSVSPSATSTTHSHSYTPLYNSTSSTDSSDADSTPSSNITSTSLRSSTSTGQASSPSKSASSSGSSTNTSSENDNNVVSSLLGGLLASSSSSASSPAPTSQSTATSSTQEGTGGASDNDQDPTDTTGSNTDSPSKTSSSTSSTPTATSSPSQSASASSNDQDSSNDSLPSSSKQGQTTQPDFYSFTPQPTRSSTSAAPSSTGDGLLPGLLPILHSSSSASNTASAGPTPTASPTGSDSGSGSGSGSGSVSITVSSPGSSSDSSNSTDEPVGQSSTNTRSSATPTADPTTTSSGKGTAPTGSADGSGTSGSGSTVTVTSHTDDTATSTDDNTGSSTASSGASVTVTAGPTSITQTAGPSPTGSNTDSGSGSGSSVNQSSSVSSSGDVPVPTSSQSDDSDSSSSSSPASSSSTTATTNPYWYANTQSLNLAPSSTSTADQPTETGSQSTTDGSSDSDTSTASTSATSGNAPATQDLPTTIVPSADSYNQPPNTTSIGLLFKQDMRWTWVISQADLTAQIFAFMPDLVGQSAGLESSKVSTVKLAGYSPETSDTASPSTLSTARTLYMAYVPTSSVEDIQAMISNTSSPFYTSAAPGAPQQLASQVDPTFNILSVAGQVAAGSKQKATTGSGSSKDESTLRNSLIGVGCGLAGVFALVTGGLLWRKNRKGKEESTGGAGGGLSRAHTIRSFSGGLRETWAPDALDQHRALDTAGQMQQVWSPHEGAMAVGHPTQAMHSQADGFGGYVADPFQDAAMGGGAAGGYVNMNRSSRMTERSNYSDLSQMTEAQRIQYDYESSRRSFHSTSDHSSSHGSHSGQSHESAGMLSTYQEDYRVPRQHTSNHAFGAPSSNNTPRSRRRGSVASSTIGRPEMMSNSVLL